MKQTRRAQLESNRSTVQCNARISRETKKLYEEELSRRHKLCKGKPKISMGSLVREQLESADWCATKAGELRPFGTTLSIRHARFRTAIIVPPNGKMDGVLLPEFVLETISSLGRAFWSTHVRPVLGLSDKRTMLAFWSESWSEMDRCFVSIPSIISTLSSLQRAELFADDQTQFMAGRLRERIVSLMGNGSDDELEFCVQTYRRAVLMARGLHGSPLPEDRSVPKLIQSFNDQARLHLLCLSALFEAAENEESVPKGTVASVLIETLRSSALSCYVFARDVRGLASEPRSA